MGPGSAAAPLDLYGDAKTASGLSNHSPEPDNECGHSGELVIWTAKL